MFPHTHISEVRHQHCI